MFLQRTMPCQPVISRVTLPEMGIRLEQLADTKQADNALKHAFCLFFSLVFPNTQYLPRSLLEEIIFLLSCKTQQDQENSAWFCLSKT